MTFLSAVPAGAAEEAAYFRAVTLSDGAQLVIRLEDRKLIRQARDIISGKDRENLHVAGTIVKAPAVYNPVWSFHLDPDSVEFFGVAAEVCDAATIMVEQNLEAVGGRFLPGGRWCPWSSRLVDEVNAPREPVLSVVSAASLSEVAISPGSLASILGEKLTKATESAPGEALPTKLAGVEVELRRAGNSQRRKAPLLLASPDRVNFVVPAEVSPGVYTVRLIRDNATDLETAARVEAVAPGVFFAEANGVKYAAATLLRVRSDGSRSEEPLVSVDGSGNIVAVPVDFGAPDDRLYLSLYGSGIGTKEISVRIGPEDGDVLYSGPQGSLQGLDQINLELPRALQSRAEADVTVSAEYGDRQSVQSAPVRLLIRRQQ